MPVNGEASYSYNYNVTPGLPAFSGGYGSGQTVFAWRSPVDFQPFTGIMDNIAVYNKALTSQQIQNHFLNTTHLSITSAAGNKVVISWPVGTLQSSTNVSGPYGVVGGATSPYTNTVSGKQLFYRAQLQ